MPSLSAIKLEPRQYYYYFDHAQFFSVYFVLVCCSSAAWMIEKEQRFDMPVAKPGQINSLELFTQIKPVFYKPVTTRAGSFIINQACNYIYRADMELASSNSTYFDMPSDQIPFRLVPGEIIATAETGGFIKTLELISAAVMLR